MGVGIWGLLAVAVPSHRHKIALFQGLAPEVAALVRTRAPAAVARVWHTFATLYLTWPCQGEERQVHFGENFVDPPDLALSGFSAMTWLNQAPAEELAHRIDLPFCHADLYYLTKLALVLERGGGN